MADSKLLEALAQGADSWAKWKAENTTSLAGEDLSGKSLRGFDFAGVDLSGASFTQADISYSSFYQADLTRCDLSSATAKGCIFTDAQLVEANLDSATLVGANFAGCDLTRASAEEADLCICNLSGATLAGTRFVRSKVWDTSFNNLDLTDAHFDDLEYQGPCDVGVGTLELTASNLPSSGRSQESIEALLRGCGVSDEWIEYFRSLIGQPIQWYSGFISYSHADSSFARRLYDQLQGRGIRCWLDEHSLRPGERILEGVNQAIRVTDRVLLCCSRNSLESWWVKDEIRKAQERERRERRDLIIPLNLDDHLHLGWEDGLATDIRSRLAADFTGWEQDNDKFEAQFEKVVASMRASKAAA